MPHSINSAVSHEASKSQFQSPPALFARIFARRLVLSSHLTARYLNCSPRHSKNPTLTVPCLFFGLYSFVMSGFNFPLIISSMASLRWLPPIISSVVRSMHHATKIAQLLKVLLELRYFFFGYLTRIVLIVLHLLSNQLTCNGDLHDADRRCQRGGLFLF